MNIKKRIEDLKSDAASIEVEIKGIKARQTKSLTIEQQDKIRRKINEINKILGFRDEVDTVLLYKERELENINAIIKSLRRVENEK